MKLKSLILLPLVIFSFTTLAYAKTIFESVPFNITMDKNDTVYADYSIDKTRVVKCISDYTKVFLDYSYKVPKEISPPAIFKQTGAETEKETLANPYGKIIVKTPLEHEVHVSCDYIYSQPN